MIFDTHAHYDDEAFAQDRETVIASLAGCGVRRVVNVGANRQSTEASLALADRYPFFRAAVGVHPSDTGEFENGQADLDWLRRCAAHPRAVAVGEIGLDYHWDTPERPIQKKWFEAQLAVAREKELPVIIHSREAAQDTLEIIKAAGGADFSMVIHCFSYHVEMAREYLNLGYYLGIGGVVTFTNGQKLKEVVQYMPLDRILLETDCPYLAPMPHRKHHARNWSGFLPLVAEEIARLKGITPKEVEQVTWQNACRFYRLPETLEGLEGGTHGETH